MAAEIRTILGDNPTLSGKETYEALKRKFPRQQINEGSAGVAFSGARKALGLAPKKRPKKKGAKKKVSKLKPAAAAQTADLSALKAAARYVSEVGDANKAIEAVRQLQTLQIQ